MMVASAQATMMLSDARAKPQIGLKTLNPHIIATISAASAAGENGPALPRQHVPAAAQGNSAGVSSFAFQARSNH